MVWCSVCGAVRATRVRVRVRVSVCLRIVASNMKSARDVAWRACLALYTFSYTVPSGGWGIFLLEGAAMYRRSSIRTVSIV